MGQCNSVCNQSQHHVSEDIKKIISSSTSSTELTKNLKDYFQSLKINQLFNRFRTNEVLQIQKLFLKYAQITSYGVDSPTLLLTDSAFYTLLPTLGRLELDTLTKQDVFNGFKRYKHLRGGLTFKEFTLGLALLSRSSSRVEVLLYLFDAFVQTESYLVNEYYTSAGSAATSTNDEMTIRFSILTNIISNSTDEKELLTLIRLTDGSYIVDSMNHNRRYVAPHVNLSWLSTASSTTGAKTTSPMSDPPSPGLERKPSPDLAATLTSIEMIEAKDTDSHTSTAEVPLGHTMTLSSLSRLSKLLNLSETSTSSIQIGLNNKKAISLVDFLTWSERHIQSSDLQAFQNHFSLLPTPSEELQRVIKLLKKTSIHKNMGVLMISAKWWDTWSAYVGGLTHFDSTGFFILSIEPFPMKNKSSMNMTSSNLSIYPESMENDFADRNYPITTRKELIDAYYHTLNSSSSEYTTKGVHSQTPAFYFVVESVYMELQKLHGGGFPLHVRRVESIFVSNEEVPYYLPRGNEASNLDIQSDEEFNPIRIEVEVNCFFLKPYYCNTQCRAVEFKRIAKDVTLYPQGRTGFDSYALIDRHVSPSILLRRMINQYLNVEEDDDDAWKKLIRRAYPSATQAMSPAEMKLENFCRLWFLFPTTQVDGTTLYSKDLFKYEEVEYILKHSNNGFWISFKDSINTPFNFPLLRSGTKCLVEFVCMKPGASAGDGGNYVWPTAKWVEQRGFRKFCVGQRVDARDYQGRWYAGEIINVVYLSRDDAALERREHSLFNRDDIIDTIRVHFDKFSSKWDESYKADSLDVAPIGSHSTSTGATSENGDLTFPEEIMTMLDSEKCFLGNRIEWLLGNGNGKFENSNPISRSTSARRTNSNKGNNKFSTSEGANDSENDDSIHNALVGLSKEQMEEDGQLMNGRQKKTSVSPSPSTKEDKELTPRSARRAVDISAKAFMAKFLESLLPRSNGVTTSTTTTTMTATSPRNDEIEDRSKRNQVSQQLTQQRSQQGKNFSPSQGISSYPGACGLLNLGNTCFMSCSLQCLSHTPLLRNYFLSDLYINDINPSNPLGSGGKLVTEFSNLLKSMWIDEKPHASPSKFKKILEKYKPMFQGCDQHDAQEFLAEILDSLHEDVNKVVNKPSLVPPEDSIWERMSLSEQAENAWTRHLSRNRSIVVDLFQGQMLSEVTCLECYQSSRTFDPFMTVSVPLPKQNEKTICIYVIRRMPHLPRLRMKDKSRLMKRKIVVDDKYYDLLMSRSAVERHCITVSKLSEVSDVREQLGNKLGIKSMNITLAEVNNGSIYRIIHDREPVSGIASFSQWWSIHGQHASSDHHHMGGGSGGNEFAVICAFEAIKDMSFVPEIPEKALMHRYGICNPNLTKPLENNTSGRGESKENEDYLDYPDILDFTEEGSDPREGDLVADLTMGRIHFDGSISLEKAIKSLRVGLRLDAMDYKNNWCTGNVAGITLRGKEVKNLDKISTNLLDYKLRVHFDNYSEKWDEDIPFLHLQERIAPAHSKTPRKLKILDIHFIQRRRPSHTITPGSPDTSTSHHHISSSAYDHMEIFGFPGLLQMETFRSCEHVYRHIVEQSLRYLTEEEILTFKENHGFDIEMATFEALEWIDVSKLPFEVRIVSSDNIRFLSRGSSSHSSSRGGGKQDNVQAWEGSLFPRDGSRPICNLFHSKLVVAVDWKQPFNRNRIIRYIDSPAYQMAEAAAIEAASRPAASSAGEVSLQDCLAASTSYETLEDKSWYCNKCKKHTTSRMRQSFYRLPDILIIHIKRFNMTARHREKIRSKVSYPLHGLDMTRYTSSFIMSHEDHLDPGTLPHHCNDNQINRPQKDIYDLYGVSNHLGGMNGGHYTAITQSYAQEGLQHKSSGDVTKAQGLTDDAISLSSTSLTHMEPLHRTMLGMFDGPDRLGNKWLHFDDDVVEEISADQVVSELAYVLFYKRRQLTPANMINLSL